MEALLPLFARAGVRASFNGHEHNFQHSRHNGIDYLITGAGSKLDKRPPERFDEAHTLTWSKHAHFLLVTVQGKTMTVRVIGEMDGNELRDVPRYTPSGDDITAPIVLQL